MLLRPKIITKNKISNDIQTTQPNVPAHFYFFIRTHGTWNSRKSNLKLEQISVRCAHGSISRKSLLVRNVLK